MPHGAVASHQIALCTRSMIVRGGKGLSLIKLAAVMTDIRRIASLWRIGLPTRCRDYK